MKTIRASEIGAYLYCQRAWWYQNQGVKPKNQAELASGQSMHARHARLVIQAGCLRTLAYLFFLLGTLLIVVNATLHLLG